MIEWFIALPLAAQAAWWTWGAMLLALAVAFRCGRVFLDTKRPWQSFLVVYAVSVGLFLLSGGMLFTVSQFFEFVAGFSSNAG